MEVSCCSCMLCSKTGIVQSWTLNDELVVEILRHAQPDFIHIRPEHSQAQHFVALRLEVFGSDVHEVRLGVP